MKKVIYLTLWCVLTLAMTAVTVHAGPAPLPAIPFMTVDEYQAAHPDQNGLRTAFNEIVQNRGKWEQTKQKQPARIVFIYPGNQISDYWRRSITSFKRRLDEIGVRYELTEHFSKPGGDYALQEKQMQAALKNDPDYLIFTMDVFKHKRLIDTLLTRTRPKLILQNITTPLREWEGKQPFMYVGFDHAIGARMLSDYYIDTTGGSGEYGMLYFTRGYVSTMRGDTFIAYTGANSQLRLFDARYTDGKAGKAQAAASAMLNAEDLKFLYACSTDIAMGGIKALKLTGKFGKVMINGWGGGRAELDAILAGDLDVTVMRMNDDNGVAMAEAIRLDLEGRSDQVPTIYSGDMELVKRGIDKQSLNRLIRRAFRYSGE